MSHKLSSSNVALSLVVRIDRNWHSHNEFVRGCTTALDANVVDTVEAAGSKHSDLAGGNNKIRTKESQDRQDGAFDNVDVWFLSPNVLWWSKDGVIVLYPVSGSLQ